MKHGVCIVLVFLSLFDMGQAAQAKTTFLVDGQPAAGGASLGEEQKLMFEASNKFVAMDFKGAEAAYDKIIAMNSGNAAAWVQRGIVRREMGDARGMAADAERALLLIDAALAQNPQDATSHHRRSVALRLLKRFDDAEVSLSEAIRLSGSKKWEHDFKAIALERKMAQ